MYDPSIPWLRFLPFVEFVAIWLLAVAAAIFAGESWFAVLVLGGLAYSGMKGFQLYKKLGPLSPEEILDLAKGRCNAPPHQPSAPEKAQAGRRALAFCAFVTRPKTRCGFRATIVGAALCGIAASGFDALVLLGAAGVMLLYGVCKIIQGGMEVY